MEKCAFKQTKQQITTTEEGGETVGTGAGRDVSPSSTLPAQLQ